MRTRTAGRGGWRGEGVRGLRMLPRRHAVLVVATGALVFAGGLVCAGSAAAITPTITEFSAGLTSGGGPSSIAAGPDGNMWFLEYLGPGRIGKITMGGVITEVATGGVTPGFSASTQPAGIAAGPDGNLWFTEGKNPGRIGKISPATARSRRLPQVG